MQNKERKPLSERIAEDQSGNDLIIERIEKIMKAVAEENSEDARLQKIMESALDLMGVFLVNQSAMTKALLTLADATERGQAMAEFLHGPAMAELQAQYDHAENVKDQANES